MTPKTLRQLREERDHWYGMARMDTRSLRYTLERVVKAEREYEEALEALKLKKQKRGKNVKDMDSRTNQ